MPTLPKLEEITSGVEAVGLLSAVQTYAGWKDAMQRSGVSRIKPDSKDTKAIEGCFQKLPPHNGKATLKEANERVAALQELSALSTSWLENKVSRHFSQELKDHPRFKAMLALNTSLSLQLVEALEIQSHMHNQLVQIPKQNVFYNLNRMFAPPGEKVNPPPLPKQTDFLSNDLIKTLDDFYSDINMDWDTSETDLVTHLSEDITVFKEVIMAKDSHDNRVSLTESFLQTLDHYQADATRKNLPDTAACIEKHRGAIADIKEIFQHEGGPRHRS